MSRYGFADRPMQPPQECDMCGEVFGWQNEYQSHGCMRLAIPLQIEMRARRARELAVIKKGNRVSGLNNIIMCDLCGSIASTKVAGTLTFAPNAVTVPEDMGCCPGCAKEIYELIMAKRGQAGQGMNAYREAFQPPEDENVTDNPTTSRKALTTELRPDFQD